MQKYEAKLDVIKNTYSISSKLDNEVYEFDSSGKHLQTLSLQLSKVVTSFSYNVGTNSQISKYNLQHQNQLSRVSFGRNIIEIQETIEHNNNENQIFIKLEGDLTKINFSKFKNLSNSTKFFNKIVFEEMNFGYNFYYSNESFLNTINAFEIFKNAVAKNFDILKIDYDTKTGAVESLNVFDKRNIKLALPVFDAQTNRLITQIKAN